jgi:hypothetical protein
MQSPAGRADTHQNGVRPHAPVRKVCVHMTLRSLAKRSSVTALFLGAMLVASVALAAWVATGNGNGSAKAKTALGPQVQAVTATVADLYPGANGDLVIKVKNQDPYPVIVTDVVLNGVPADITSDGSANCQGLGTGVTMTDQSGLSGVAYELDAVGGANDTKTITLDDVLSMSNSSHTDCQGVLFTIPVTVTTTSNA